MALKAKALPGFYNPLTGVYTPPNYGPAKKGFDKISPNCYRGLPVRTFEELITLADDHKPVIIYYGPNSGVCKITSAFWLLWRRRGADFKDYLKYNHLYHCVKEEDF
jgi:hypothetical protein